MKYSLLSLLLFTISAKAQVPFERQYKDCAEVSPCFYCGDIPAHYKKSISGKIQSSLDHGSAKWMSTSGRIFFEIQVDSIGHSCVHSIKDETHMSDVKENIRRCINNLWDWSPAELAHHPINSTVILELHFIGDDANVRFVKPEEIR